MSIELWRATVRVLLVLALQLLATITRGWALNAAWSTHAAPTG